MNTCNICCSKVSQNKLISCVYCNEEACKTCIKTYLTSNVQLPNCLYCKKEWSDEYLHMHFSKEFIKTSLKTLHKQIILQNEMSYLQSTQRQLQIHAEKERIKYKIKELTNLRRNKRREVDAITGEINRLKNDLLNNTNIAENIYDDGNNDVVMGIHCAKDTCNGLLNASNVCIVCHEMTCTKCHEIMHENHVCDSLTLETINTINENCKQCPNCGIHILKTPGGCDQMWCTACKTTFSWNTGMIEQTNIHNPHYYEWVKDMNNGVIQRDFLDIPCGGLPTYQELTSRIESSQIRVDYPVIMRCYALITDLLNTLKDYRIYVNQVENTINFNTNIDLRLEYMMNNISETTFVDKVYRRKILIKRNKSIGYIIHMMVICGSEVFRNLCDVSWDRNYITFIDRQLKTLDKLVVIYNDAVASVCKMYNCAVYYIDEDVRLRYGKMPSV